MRVVDCGIFCFVLKHPYIKISKINILNQSLTHLYIFFRSIEPNVRELCKVSSAGMLLSRLNWCECNLDVFGMLKGTYPCFLNLYTDLIHLESH